MQWWMQRTHAHQLLTSVSMESGDMGSVEEKLCMRLMYMPVPPPVLLPACPPLPGVLW